ncbi:Maf family protein [Lysinibacillus sp. KU-BSD001]|uniref:Maf family protein n=1 Tax=Lysinibacillus sp. KU-BSD001 TaxID=3141328 RepID=UPI0036EA0C22
MNFKTTHAVVLASASPRRKELFSLLNIPFDIVTSDVEETSVKAQNVQQYVTEVALLKTRDVAKKCPDKLVIGADTIVVYNDCLLHKPKSRQEAIEHLQTLSNDVHTVMTAVALIDPNGTERTFVEETKVVFKEIPSALMEAYVASGDPFDKAGGYGIQTDGVFFVDRIEGDYNNVVGLPLASLVEHLLSLQYISI